MIYHAAVYITIVVLIILAFGAFDP